MKERIFVPSREEEAQKRERESAPLNKKKRVSKTIIKTLNKACIKFRVLKFSKKKREREKSRRLFVEILNTTILGYQSWKTDLDESIL